MIYNYIDVNKSLEQYKEIYDQFISEGVKTK